MPPSVGEAAKLRPIEAAIGREPAGPTTRTGRSLGGNIEPDAGERVDGSLAVGWTEVTMAAGAEMGELRCCGAGSVADWLEGCWINQY